MVKALGYAVSSFKPFHDSNSLTWIVASREERHINQIIRSIPTVMNIKLPIWRIYLRVAVPVVDEGPEKSGHEPDAK